MTDYIALRVDIEHCSADATDLLAAFLADMGYESFEPDDNGLTAYIQANDFNRSDAEALATDFPIDCKMRFSDKLVKGENWNEEWEKHYFEPIVVGGKVVVHSSFHTDVPQADFDIVVDPKMAFGTGHHATTSMMLRLILDSDMAGKSVIDLGTGTGILAMLAKMKGASDTVGIDIDEDAVANARENAQINHCDITFFKGDASSLQNEAPADYLFANINRNVLLNDMERYSRALKPGGSLFLSGFYEEDIPMLEQKGNQYGMQLEKRLTDNRWAAMHMIKG